MHSVVPRRTRRVPDPILIVSLVAPFVGVRGSRLRRAGVQLAHDGLVVAELLQELRVLVRALGSQPAFCKVVRLVADLDRVDIVVRDVLLERLQQLTRVPRVWVLEACADAELVVDARELGE